MKSERQKLDPTAVVKTESANVEPEMYMNSENSFPHHFKTDIDYPVDHVCLKVSINKDNYFIVRWVGYPPSANTLEPSSSFTPDEFETHINGLEDPPRNIRLHNRDERRWIKKNKEFCRDCYPAE
jgi:hypothetical protein